MQYNASEGGTRNSEYPPYGHKMENEQFNYMGFQQPPYQQDKKPNLEEMLTKFISMYLPSNTESNPREQLNAITIQDEEGLVELEPEPRQGIVVSKGKGEVDHSEQKLMPNAVKFLKKLLENKQKLDEASHVELNVVCSAILQNKLANKLKYPGSFTIPCLIGSLNVKNALADLGASINVMPYKMFKQLGELTLRVGDDSVTLQARNPINTDHVVQPSLQETRLKSTHEHCSKMRSVNSSHYHDHAKGRFSNPHGQAHGRALGRAHTTGGAHTLAHHLCSRLIKQHGRAPIHTGVGEANEVGHGSATRPCAPTRPKDTDIMSNHGKKTVVPALKKRKGAASSSGRYIDWAVLEQVQLAGVVRALLSTDPWELFFGIIKLTYLELTLELCLTFHFQTVMIEFDDPGTVQFCLGGLVIQLSVPEFGIALGLYTEEFMDDNELNTLHRHIHYSPLKCWSALVPDSTTYDPSRSKASALAPSLRYLHAILAYTLKGWRESTGIVNTHDAYFL
ncbi:hypothetical protein GOBAR_AA35520 [Gossypium barbadense]|uniref:Uncharacterized protein n=1 Tax=Gossypium barbadense TaxID=3634 RepID=A0A2P5W276_GOSBA|nr:hypothetical protein GOBAR_AA35520 [Gossypium barbadense]